MNHGNEHKEKKENNLLENTMNADSIDDYFSLSNR